VIDVAYWHFSDLTRCPSRVRYAIRSGHRKNVTVTVTVIAPGSALFMSGETVPAWHFAGTASSLTLCSGSGWT
jgi:hypothetical protein